MPQSKQPPRVLTIAGSDSGGGAGIQADLKTFAALGAYGMSAITALTAQDTQKVHGVHDVPPDFVAKQIDAVAEDIGFDAVKTGMLATAPIVATVAMSLQRHNPPFLVVDPVMVSKSGDTLLQETAQKALKERLLPLATIVTPNVLEAEVLSGISPITAGDLEDAAEKIYGLGPDFVLIKGGHLPGDAVDYLWDGDTMTEFAAPRIESESTHGTGCTYSAAIAVYLAQGLDVPGAISRAKEYVTGAIERGLPLGKGHGPLNHGWMMKTQ